MKINAGIGLTSAINPWQRTEYSKEYVYSKHEVAL